MWCHFFPKASSSSCGLVMSIKICVFPSIVLVYLIFFLEDFVLSHPDLPYLTLPYPIYSFFYLQHPRYLQVVLCKIPRQPVLVGYTYDSTTLLHTAPVHSWGVWLRRPGHFHHLSVLWSTGDWWSDNTNWGRWMTKVFFIGSTSSGNWATNSLESPVFVVISSCYQR